MKKNTYHYIPDQAFLYLPQNTDLKIGHTRRIFQGNVHYDQYQQKQLIQFQKYLIKKNISIDKYWTRQNRIRFLQSCEYNYQKTINHMSTYIQWRNQNIPPKLTTPVQKYLNQGIFYFSGRDCKYRPILIFDIKKMVDLGIKSEDLNLTQAYFFNFVIENLLLQGQVENWIAIIDLNYINIFSVVGMLKQSITFLSNTFRCRMFACYLVRTPGSISFGWGLVKKFLEEQTIKKISFYDAPEPTPLFTHANKSQIEMKYGGNCANITQFWPPKLSDNNFEVDDSKKHLINKYQYRKRYQENKLKNHKINMKIIDEVQQQEKRKLAKEQQDKQNLMRIKQIEQTKQKQIQLYQNYQNQQQILIQGTLDQVMEFHTNFKEIIFN